MKICFYNHDSHLYGASKSLLNLLDELRQIEDLQLIVILPEKGELEQKLVELKINYQIIHSYNWASGINFISLYSFLRYIYYWCIRTIGNIRSIPLHKDFLKKWDPDIIYSNTSVIPIGFILAKLLGKKHVWHIREFIDLDHALGLDFGIKLLRIGLYHSDLVLAVSNPVANHILPKGKNTVKVVFNGVATRSEFNKRKADWLSIHDGNTFTFSIVGSISYQKGQEEAIHAFAKLAKDRSDLRLLVAGNGGGSEFKSLVEEVNKEIKGKIVHLGHVSNINEVYMLTNCLLMCSKNEAFGRVTVEGMSYGIPVIGYNNMGTSIILENKVTGYLYGNGYPELDIVMEEVLQSYSSALKIGEKGWEYAKSEFSQERYALKIYEHLKRI